VKSILTLFLAVTACASTDEPLATETITGALRTAAVDPLEPGPAAVSTGEYRFEAVVDPDVLAVRATEVWAQMWWPTTLEGRHPLIVLLHGNHGTCGRGENPRIDDRTTYTTTGTCPEGYVVTPNHMGYDYLASHLASWGYVVVSINANRGITAGGGVAGDNGLNLARGKLILKHLELLSAWNRGLATPPETLGVDLADKLDFDQLGLLGHSRGGEGIRAAYNLYRDAGSIWPERIGAVGFRGLFEIGPVDGQTSRVLDADGVAWNVILPMCDGDVSNLAGMKPFDRMLARDDEATPAPKGMFAIWGTNHNFFNTEWQTSDSSGCSGTGHVPLFGSTIAGSEPQRVAARYAAFGFFRSAVGVEVDATLGQTLDPSFTVPEALAAVTRVDRAYSDGLGAARSRIVEDFLAGPVAKNGGAFAAAGVTTTFGAVFEHDARLRSVLLGWTEDATADTWFEIPLGSVDASAFTTLDLRLALAPTAAQPGPVHVTLTATDAAGQVSAPIALDDYIALDKHGGHIVLPTARVPLAELAGIALPFDVTELASVRLTFAGSAAARVHLAQLRLSTAPATPVEPPPAPEPEPTPEPTPEPGPIVVATGNALALATGGSTTELAIDSAAGFPITDELPVLHVGGTTLVLGRYPDDGSTTRMLFQVTAAELAALRDGAEVRLDYGTDRPARRWVFGRLDKRRLLAR
jgi:hypothetical protein